MLKIACLRLAFFILHLIINQYGTAASAETLSAILTLRINCIANLKITAMKKLLLLIATLTTLTAKSQTSVYHPFPDSSAVWNIDSYQWCGLGFDRWEYLYSIIFSGDTIINSINYHKLNVPIEVVQSNGMCLASGSWTVAGHYGGSVRQDTSIKKVFYVPPS